MHGAPRMPAWDTGEIIRNHVYMRKVYSADRNGGEECLFSSEELHDKLACIYDRLGVEPRSEDELSVVVKLPRNTNPYSGRGGTRPPSRGQTSSPR